MAARLYQAFGLIGLVPALAWAQIPAELPKPSPAALFRTQCGTCHVLNPADGPRQGPPLKGVVGRKPGAVEGFKYSGNYGAADFTWDPEHLDAYLADPQAVIPGSVMAYRQANPRTRATIIAYLQEQR
jgi:cytochrome c